MSRALVPWRVAVRLKSEPKGYFHSHLDSLEQCTCELPVSTSIMTSGMQMRSATNLEEANAWTKDVCMLPWTSDGLAKSQY